MLDGDWSESTPTAEGVYEMKSSDGTVEVVEIHDLAIDRNPSRPRNFHVIHVNGPDPEDPDHYSLTAFGQYDQFAWRRVDDLAAESDAKAENPEDSSLKTPPVGNKTPASSQTSVTQFARDPAVVAWVLKEAAGICECCRKPAPFEREDGSLFLEVHHVLRLTDGGEDTIENAVALCPNCHRELHYGVAKSDLAAKLRREISRLSSGVTNKGG